MPTFAEVGIKLPLRTWNGISFVANTPEQFASFVDATRAAFAELLKVVQVKPR